jgi:osmotically-inducible protein OsmY
VVLEVEQGNVLLEGRVDTEDLAESIVDFTRRIPGVVSVESKLTWPRTKARRQEKATA